MLGQSEKNPKVAFVHDFLVSYGGAERVLESLLTLYPDAPVYTLLHDSEAMRGRFSDKDIRTSFLQKFPSFLRKRYRWLLPLFPVAIETIDLREFDLVISSSGAWSKGIVTRLRTKHISYLHSPMRLLWDSNERYLSSIRSGRIGRFFGRIVLSYLRIWDREAADRPDKIVVNSEYTGRRVAKYYRRNSKTIYPPVRLSGAGSSDGIRRDFFLIVSRLTESKGVGIAIEAFNKLGLPLLVVGAGREQRRLRSAAGATIRFTGWVEDEKLVTLYRKAKAVIVPSEEDFGMMAAESIALGTPVIALGKGGSLEIVEEGKTGEFFGAATPEVLADAVRRFLARDETRYVESCRAVGNRFSEEKFLSEWKNVIGETLSSDQ